MPELDSMERVGWRFVAWYVAAYLSAILLLISPLLVTLALKVDALVGDERAPANLSVVAGVGALAALVGNPLAGRLSDRTTSRFGRRRPWLVVGVLGGSAAMLGVALARSIVVVVLGWCAAQLFLNAMLAALVAVLADRVPSEQRGLVSGVLGVCLPAASVAGTWLVNLFSGSQLAMFMAPCAIGVTVLLLFAARLEDPPRSPVSDPSGSLRRLGRTFYVSPRRHPDFAWAFASRFLFVTAYALLTTYQVFFLLDRVGTRKDDVAHQVFLATTVASVLVVVASLAGGRLSDRTGRRKPFVLGAAVIFAAAMFLLAAASTYDGFVVAVAVSGLGLGAYVAVDLALVVDVLPDAAHAARDLGVANIAGALPYSVAPAVAPSILAIGGYGALYSIAGGCALLGGLAVLKVRHVR